MTPELWLIVLLAMVSMFMLGRLAQHLHYVHQRNKRIAEMAKAQAERRRQHENQKGSRPSA